MDDVPARDGVEVAAADASGNGGAFVVPKLEPGKAQMTRLHARGRVWKEECFPEPMGFPAQMELRQLEESPGPLAPARRMAPVPALPAFLATTYRAGQPYSHRPCVLETVG